jgi:hypothetical protein
MPVRTTATAAVLALVTMLPTVAAAQEPANAQTGRVTVAGSVDFLNAYAFRGITQDDTGLIVWPSVNLGVRVFEGSGALKALTLNVGTWNSLHTGVAGSDGPSGDRWYESDIHTALNFTVAGGVTVGTTYRAYTSPNDMFTTVKEIALRLAVDDRAALGRVPIRPYTLVAFELDTQPGIGQADGGFEAGKYLEIGAAPRFSVGALDVAVPVKVGLSLGGYYELAGHDHSLGYFSTAGVATVPIGRRTKLGAWNVHGGVEYQELGAMTKALNDGDDSRVIGSFGVGWSR